MVLCFWCCAALMLPMSAHAGTPSEFDSGSPHIIGAPVSGLYGCGAPSLPSLFHSKPYLRVSLQPLLNRQWKASPNIVSGDSVYLSVQFDRNEYPYVGLWGM